LYPVFYATSASLLIQENADPDVLKDLANFMAKLVPSLLTFTVPKGWMMPALIRTALTIPQSKSPSLKVNWY